MNDDHRDCPHLPNAAPYALGAIDDARDYAAHLKECDICAAEAAALSSAMQKLPQTPAPVKAPRGLIDRVMESVRAEAQLLDAAGAGADPEPRQQHGVFERVRHRRLAVFGSGAALIACFAAIALAIAIQPGSDRVLRGEVAAQITGAEAKLVESDGSAHLEVAGMPAPGAGRVYEVWIKHPDGRISATDSLFGVTGGGDGSVHVTNSLDDVSAVLVTSEPAGGSSTPTRKPVVTVKVPS